MDLQKALNQFYYDMTLNELRMMNQNALYPNISYNGLLYLELIDLMEPCTVSRLAGALQISKAAVTMKVGDLIRQGFVERTQSDTDKRVYYLHVRPEVVEDYRKYDVAITRAVETIQAQFSQEDIDRFAQMFATIRTVYFETLQKGTQAQNEHQ